MSGVKILGKRAGVQDWEPVAVDANGRLLIASSGGGTLAIEGTKTPSDAYANPTTAIDAVGLTMGWDGGAAQWKRVGAATPDFESGGTVNGASLGTIAHLFGASTAGDWYGVRVEAAADDKANPTYALEVNSHLHGYDGGTWDRLRVAAPSDTKTNPTAALDVTAHLEAWDAGPAVWRRVPLSTSVDGVGITGIDTIARFAAYEQGVGWRLPRAKLSTSGTPMSSYAIQTMAAIHANIGSSPYPLQADDSQRLKTVEENPTSAATASGGVSQVSTFCIDGSDTPALAIIKASAGRLLSIYWFAVAEVTGGTVIQFHDRATAPVAGNVPVFALWQPDTGEGDLHRQLTNEFFRSYRFSTGIVVALSTSFHQYAEPTTQGELYVTGTYV